MRRTSDVLKDRARFMRRNPTKAEQLLWIRLKGGREDGLRFRRQHQEWPFIVDLVCLEAMLAIEIDGDNHQLTGEADAKRRLALEESGFKVIRFTNFEVLSDPHSCVIGILHAAYARVPRLTCLIEDLPTW